MTTDDTRRRRPPPAQVDFTLMYAVHDAFLRDLRYLTAAVEAGRSADDAMRAGWATGTPRPSEPLHKRDHLNHYRKMTAR